jgi:hypothetical protein
MIKFDIKFKVDKYLEMERVLQVLSSPLHQG